MRNAMVSPAQQKPLKMEPQDLVAYMSKRAERLQEKRLQRRKTLIERNLKDLGLVQEDSEKRLMQRLLSSERDLVPGSQKNSRTIVEPGRPGVDRETIEHVHHLQDKARLRAPNYFEMKAEDKLFAFNELYQDSSDAMKAMLQARLYSPKKKNWAHSSINSKMTSLKSSYKD